MNKQSLSLFLRKHMLKILVICTSVSIFSMAFMVRSDAQHALMMETSRFQQQQAMNSTADESAVILANYLNLYKALQQQGIIGAPKRLQWLESVQINATSQLIPNLNFVLFPTEVTADTKSIAYSLELETQSTLMQVTFTLLHEGDFYHLLKELKLKSRGVFNVEECEIRRNDDLGKDDITGVLQGTFIGSCQLRWFSITDITRNWEASAP